MADDFFPDDFPEGGLVGFLFDVFKRGDPKPLARYIEAGGDLSELTAEQRVVVGRLVRGLSPRKPGERLEAFRKKVRDYMICAALATLKGAGFAPTGRGAEIVAKRVALSVNSVRRAWGNRSDDDAWLNQLECEGRALTEREAEEEALELVHLITK